MNPSASRASTCCLRGESCCPLCRRRAFVTQTNSPIVYIQPSSPESFRGCWTLCVLPHQTSLYLSPSVISCKCHASVLTIDTDRRCGIFCPCRASCESNIQGRSTIRLRWPDRKQRRTI